MKSRIRQLLASCAVASVASALVLTGSVAAQAVTPGPRLGSLVLSPQAGTDTSPITVTSSGACDPATAPDLRVVLTGPGFPAGGQNVVGTSPTSNYTVDKNGYDVSLQDSLADFAALQSPVVTYSGTYTLTLICQDAFDQVEQGSYDASISFTDPHDWKVGVAAVATTTTLTASPAGDAAAGSPVTMTAAVTPSSAAGTVQFLDGGVALGSPVAVTSGTASLTTTALSAATHTLTATFTPTAPVGATPSTSTGLAYTVNAPIPAAPAVTSAAALVLPVGTVVTCPNGSRLPVPASALGNAIHCNSGPTIVGSEGAAPVALIAPSLTGSGKVGSRLTLKPGLWTPAYASRTVTWKRDGKAIARQTGSTYVVKKTDKGHHISVSVVAHLPGHLDGKSGSALVVAKAAAAMTLQVPQAVSGDATPIGIPVGSVIGCVGATFSGATTTTSSWLLDGKAYAAAGVLVVGDALSGHQLECQTTATNAGGAVTSEAVVSVVPGPALRSYVKPTITGVVKAGKKLTANAGKWYPVYAKATFVWLRDGKAIKGASKATYATKASDKTHHFAVRVTVTRAGWGAASATSTAVILK